jgi:diguanylate cyclase (GGDEF)-like protein
MKNNNMECIRATAINNHCKIIKEILIIESSKSLADYLKEKIDKHFFFRCDIALNESMARDMIQHKEYDLLVVDLNLPDSSGNFIGELIRNDHRVIIMTDEENEESRSKLIALSLVDYVIKSDTKFLVNYLLKTIQRLNDNCNTVIGICDDSKFLRAKIISLVELQNLAYIEFEDGQQVLDCMESKHASIDLLITDYVMPRVDGLELVRRIRHKYTDEKLPIIALTASEKPHLLANFLKVGSNDYLPKTFTNEEFLTRLNLTLDHLYMSRKYNQVIQELEEISIRDFLSKLYNRHYFFLQIGHISADAIRKNIPYGILMIDIDFFKNVNDTYGHQAGDSAIQHFSSVLQKTVRASDYCFRWGGEEFLVLLPSVDQSELVQLAERIRRAVENSSVIVGDDDLIFHITVSIGGALCLDKDVKSLISKADELLYEAKQSGRNCVKI